MVEWIDWELVRPLSKVYARSVKAYNLWVWEDSEASLNNTRDLLNSIPAVFVDLLRSSCTFWNRRSMRIQHLFKASSHLPSTEELSPGPPSCKSVTAIRYLWVGISEAWAKASRESSAAKVLQKEDALGRTPTCCRDDSSTLPPVPGKMDVSPANSSRYH